jgi:hypothetical protein
LALPFPTSLIHWSFGPGKTLLEAANKVRPSIFQDRVVAQLMTHPKLITIPSENRATFSFYARLAEPRDSWIDNAKQYIVTQLGHPADGVLGVDILNELVRARIQQLQVSKMEFKKIQHSITGWNGHNDWDPFVESLLIAVDQ